MRIVTHVGCQRCGDPHGASVPCGFSTPALDAWRIAHGACVSHLRACLECGVELCADGQALWDAADEAEARLPWRLSA